MKSRDKVVEQNWENVLNCPPLQSLKRSGIYRAKVIETNDPLNMNRLRVKVPELHDDDMPAEYAPWACPAPSIGGRGAFFFVSATIGDWVWIQFEKEDPHTPVYTGFANPTRRGAYSIQQIHIETQPVLDENGNENRRRVGDFDSRYLPKDGRPMKTGYVDTYGNSDMSSAVGYFPIEHQEAPAPADLGTNSSTSITRRRSPPQVNNPDLKYMLRMTKYGHLQLMSDQGYYWKKEEQGITDSRRQELGEFTGDRDLDYAYEAKRWLAIQRLISEDDPTSKDRRRQLFMTRYGHVFDMRDVGWGQLGPIASKSRSGEYGPRRYVSDEEKRDQRFMRMRTKGGMYFIMGDRGFHPEEDKYVKRRLYDDLRLQDQELERHWGGTKDARFMGFISRYGWKFILDDRGSDARNADKRDRPRGQGILLKGRRRPGTGTDEETNALGKQRGFWLQVVERDALNHMQMGSPMGHSIEMSDKYQYLMMASTLGRRWGSEWKGFRRHEYNPRTMMQRNPEKNSHHLKLDHANEYIRLKTRGGRGPQPIGNVVEKGVGKREIQQGFEARDGKEGDGPWVELVDAQRRGIWMSKSQQLLILRGKKRKRLYIWLNDAPNREIVIFNGERNGKVKIYTQGSIELKAAKDITLDAGRLLNLRGRRVQMQADAGAKMTLASNIFTNCRISGAEFRGFFRGVFPGPGAGFPVTSGTVSVEPLEPPTRPEKIEPSDRGQTYNGPYEGIDPSEFNPQIDDSTEN
jgi:hypothetical protein